MPIESYIPYQPTTGQWLALKKLQQFFDGGDDVFILRGFAGTGKTTLVKGVLDYLDSRHRPYQLMASTGRAARVLANKTQRHVNTIHSSIYELDYRKTKVNEKVKQLAFRIRPNSDGAETIYFIDESSMIADKTEVNQNLLFDDGRFLEHIFRFAGKRKIVFIGDTAQLPPVNCNFSAALDLPYLTDRYRKKVIDTDLTEVKRQDEFCGILQNATRLRETLSTGRIPPMSLNASGWPDVIIKPNVWSSISHFVRFGHPAGPDKAVFTALSNGSTHFLNNQIRKNIFKEATPPLMPDDWLMVVQNNSATGYNNGQHLILKSYSDNGEQVGDVELIDAVVQDQDGELKKVKLIKNLLFDVKTNLSQEQDLALTVDFSIRMKKAGIIAGTEEFVQRLIFDKRLNALRVKFGYAITCHKAQGGEWEQLYLHLEPAFEKLPRDAQYRWMYTAITRASKYLLVPEHPMIY
ncbi:ATP-dependent RecD-like DNA helicase [Mangrovibacterium sp.]|uniref:ATP-dependent DNA helicase n=1 Tax=Mangrovibacterium sp. TaxID=1961364 RepID=UPI0035632FE6